MRFERIAEGSWVDLDKIRTIDVWQDSEWFGLLRTKIRWTTWHVRFWIGDDHGPYIYRHAADKVEALSIARELADSLNNGGE